MTVKRSYHQRDLPGYLTRSLEEAGASAYQWHDESMADHVDSTGMLRKAGRGLHYGAVGAAVLAVVVLAILSAQPSSVVVALLLCGSWAWCRFRSVPWIVSGVAAVWLLNFDKLAPQVVSGIILFVLVACFLLRPRQRGVTLLVAAVASALVTSVTWDSAVYSVLAVASVLVPLLVAVGAVGVQALPRPWMKVTEGDLTSKIPSPALQLPWLVRAVKRREIASAPDEVRRKKIGADGERRTGLLLLALARGRGTRIAHDVAIPGADAANADHVVVAPSGLFVIDSKRFGSKGDPGIVTYDMGSRQIVHRTSRGSRSIEQSVKTAVWATEGISNLVGVPGKALFVIHNAAVAEGLRFTRNGIEVEVISAGALVDRIDSAPRMLSLSQLAGARMGMFRLKSVTTGGAPHVISPVGATEDARKVLGVLAMSASAPAVSVPQVKREQKAPQPSKSKVQRTTHVVHAPISLSPPPKPTESATPVPDAADSIPMTVQDRVEDRWSQMVLSDPVLPDEVDAELRKVSRGTPITILEFTNEQMNTYNMVAMSGVCHSPEGNFVWYCSPEQYRLHKATGRSVNVATVSAAKVMVNPEVT